MSNKNVIYQQIRNATVKIKYHGLTFLVDPYLVPKGATGCFSFSPKPEQKKIKNPTKDLPIPINEIIKGVDAVIATYIHEDHWDKDAAKNIPTIFLFLFKMRQIKKKFKIKDLKM